MQTTRADAGVRLGPGASQNSDALAQGPGWGAGAGGILQTKPSAKRRLLRPWGWIILAVLGALSFLLVLWLAALWWVSEPMVDPSRVPPRLDQVEAQQ